MEERSKVCVGAADSQRKLPKIENGGVLGLGEAGRIDEDECTAGVVWVVREIPLKRLGVRGAGETKMEPAPSKL